jgi:hypothetical protein
MDMIRRFFPKMDDEEVVETMQDIMTTLTYDSEKEENNKISESEEKDSVVEIYDYESSDNNEENYTEKEEEMAADCIPPDNNKEEYVGKKEETEASNEQEKNKQEDNISIEDKKEIGKKKDTKARRKKRRKRKKNKEIIEEDELDIDLENGLVGYKLSDEYLHYVSSDNNVHFHECRDKYVIIVTTFRFTLSKPINLHEISMIYYHIARDRKVGLKINDSISIIFDGPWSKTKRESTFATLLSNDFQLEVFRQTREVQKELLKVLKQIVIQNIKNIVKISDINDFDIFQGVASRA